VNFGATRVVVGLAALATFWATAQTNWVAPDPGSDYATIGWVPVWVYEGTNPPYRSTIITNLSTWRPIKLYTDDGTNVRSLVLSNVLIRLWESNLVLEPDVPAAASKSASSK